MSADGGPASGAVQSPRSINLRSLARKPSASVRMVKVIGALWRRKSVIAELQESYDHLAGVPPQPW